MHIPIDLVLHVGVVAVLWILGGMGHFHLFRAATSQEMLYAIVGTILKNKRIHLHHRMHFVTFANPRQMHAILIMLLTVAGIGLLGLRSTILLARLS
jgi:hypothetical protein